MKIAFIAHDNKKDDIIDFVKRYKNIFMEHELYATGTTGRLLNEIVGLKVHRFLSGPLGGDQQIGAKVALGELDLIIFLRDPLTVQPHEPDVSALLRLCDVHHVPLATNVGTAEIFAKALKSHCNNN
ncbi:methylglyoxal synthase [Clostridium sp. KNHs214]|uniref:methylglyoxal synthase n=1 Tax=Clostridium sp. KNHs214 TaxID=1540257 RepID=UPI0005531A3E|nr:methylglyoxal synthase [Clostridium sp. KNHs214]